jgi:hypothetical protein
MLLAPTRYLALAHAERHPGPGHVVRDVLTLPLALSAFATFGYLLSIVLISEGRQSGWYLGILALVPTGG